MSGLSGLTEATGLSGDGDLNDQGNQKEIFEQMPNAQKDEIEKNIEEFDIQRKEADQELEKWDDSQNDLITLARKMTQIMHQMTEYTRGEGQLKTNKDVIRAASKLSHYGVKLRACAIPIVENCTDKRLADQLRAHVDMIEPLQHQLKVLSRVKQEVEQVAGELVVSGLDSVTSLIQNARNLLGAVLETVRAAHTCSIRMDASPITWNPKMPGKKPLVINESEESQKRRKLIRRETHKYTKSENQLRSFIDM
jgi:catenin alpha